MAFLTEVFGKSKESLEVDKTFLAARVAMRPLDYKKNGRVLGHYGINTRSGELAATIGVLMTFGSTLILTASSTFRPARSMAAARSNESSMDALSAAIRALTTAPTLPPAR